MWLERSWNYGSCARRLPRAWFLALRSLLAAVVVAASRARGSFLPLPPGRPDFVSRVPTARATSASRRFASVREPIATRDAIAASRPAFAGPTERGRNNPRPQLAAFWRNARREDAHRSGVRGRHAQRSSRRLRIATLAKAKSARDHARTSTHAHQHTRAPAHARTSTLARQQHARATTTRGRGVSGLRRGRRRARGGSCR